MKKIKFLTNLMCVLLIASNTFAEYQPVVPYRDKDKTSYSKEQLMSIVKSGKGNVSENTFMARGSYRYDDIAKHDGYYANMSPKVGEDPSTFWQIFMDGCDEYFLDPGKKYRMDAWDPLSRSWKIIERLPYPGEKGLRSRPDVINPKYSNSGMPFWLSLSCGNFFVEIYETNLKVSPKLPFVAASNNNDGYTQVAPSTGGERYAESEFRETEETGNTYITNNYFSDEGEINYEQDEYGEYQDSRLSFWFSLNISAGPIYVNPYSNYGYVGNQPGFYNGNYSQPYVCIGHQGNNGVPSISNVSYFNQTVNNIYNYNYNYNYNSTTIITNPPPVPPVIGNPIDPSTGGIAYEPIDPSNRTQAGFAKNKGIAPIKGIKQVPVNQNDGLAGNSIPRPMKPADVDSRPKTNSSATASTNSEQSIPRPMKPGATVDSRPKTNLNQGTAVADSRPNPSTGSVKPEPRPSQKPPNQFTRPVAQQDQSQANQTPQSRPATKQNQTQTNGSTQSRPQENRSNYKQNPRGSNPQPTQQSRQGYGNSSPSQIAQNTSQPNRGSAPTGGRGNSGGGNYGGQRR